MLSIIFLADSFVQFRVVYGGTFYKCKANLLKYRKGKMCETNWVEDFGANFISKVVMEDTLK